MLIDTPSVHPFPYMYFYYSVAAFSLWLAEIDAWTIFSVERKSPKNVGTVSSEKCSLLYGTH